MQEFTKVLKVERNADVVALKQHNNSKLAKMTQEQKEQAYRDKQRAFYQKWNSFSQMAETPAQKNICKEMLQRVENMPKFFR